LGFVFLAAICYAISPVAAGEHPWDENDSPGGKSGHPGNGLPSPGDTTITPTETTVATFGTTLWWWELLVDGPREIEGRHVTAASVATHTKTGTDPKPTCKTER